MKTEDIIKLPQLLSPNVNVSTKAMIPIAGYCDKIIRNIYIETERGLTSISQILAEERIYDTDEDIKDIIQNVVIHFWRALHSGLLDNSSPKKMLAYLNYTITNLSKAYAKEILEKPIVVFSQLPEYHNYDDFVDYRDLWNEYNRSFLPQREQLVSNHSLILRLKKLLQSLNDPLQHDSAIQKAIDKPDENDEFGILLNKAFQQLYDAGKQSTGLKIANSGRAQLVKNADQHAIDITPHVRRFIQNGASTLQDIADNLNREGILTKNANEWHASTVKLLLERINILQPDNPVTLSQDFYLFKMHTIINQLKENGVNSLSGIASALNDQNIPTKNGKKWYAAGVSNLLEKLQDISGRKR